MVWDIATSAAEQQVDDADPKVRKRGEARGKKLIPEQRSEIARKAAKARWHKE